MLQRAAKARSVNVSIEVAPEAIAYADHQALDQVLVNLLDNAIKFRSRRLGTRERPGRPGPRSRVRRGDGPGIQERHRLRIFERFYRIDAGRSRAVGGTGLGLSIVKHLVSLMNGSVGVDPVSPHGSAFWVNLPCPAPASAAAPDHHDRPAA